MALPEAIRADGRGVGGSAAVAPTRGRVEGGVGVALATAGRSPRDAVELGGDGAVRRGEGGRKIAAAALKVATRELLRTRAVARAPRVLHRSAGVGRIAPEGGHEGAGVPRARGVRCCVHRRGGRRVHGARVRPPLRRGLVVGAAARTHGSPHDHDAVKELQRVLPHSGRRGGGLQGSAARFGDRERREFAR